MKGDKMKQLALEYVRTKENDNKIKLYGFKETQEENEYFYNYYHNDKIIIFSDNSVDVSMIFSQTLSMLLNLIDMGIIKVIEE